jgi:uracil-DNA glycosylase
MLSGKPPTVHSYIGPSHVFANEIRMVFGDHDKLLEQAVGMNLWHFQAVKNAASAPKPLRDFCEEITRTLVAAMKPATILCIGAYAFDALTKGISVDRLMGHSDIRTATVGTSKIFGVPHLTGSYTRVAAAACTPMAVDAIAKYLTEKPS